MLYACNILEGLVFVLYANNMCKIKYNSLSSNLPTTDQNNNNNKLVRNLADIFIKIAPIYNAEFFKNGCTIFCIKKIV